MAGSPTADKSLAELQAAISNTISIVGHLEAIVLKPSADSDSKLDALSIARDSASLIKAHSTKISLLIINEPFTPTAITKVLRELIAGPLPALASATELCDVRRYTDTLRGDLTWRCHRVLKSFAELVRIIPTDGGVLAAEKKDGSGGSRAERGSIPATGMLWSACDDVAALCKLGIAGHLIQKVEQFRDMLKDTMEELKEWGDEVGDESDDEGGGGSGGGGDDDRDDDHVEDSAGDHEGGGAYGDSTPPNAVGSVQGNNQSAAQQMLDAFVDSQQRIPREDPDRIRERLEFCLKRLRLTTLLHQALIKRRLKCAPALPSAPGSDVPSRLDEALGILKIMPERFENLAMAFYALDPREIDRLSDECFFDAFAASELLARPWTGQRDEFTDWVKKFQVEIKKT